MMRSLEKIMFKFSKITVTSSQLSRCQNLAFKSVVPLGRLISSTSVLPGAERRSSIDTRDLISLVDKPKRPPEFLDTWVYNTSESYTPGATQIDWNDVISQATEKNRYNRVDSRSFGGVLLGFCKNHQNWDIAHDYITWKKDPTVGELALYMFICKDFMKRTSEEEMLDLYERIKKKSLGLWTHELAENVIPTLLRTSKWRDSLDIVKAVQKHSVNKLKARSDIIAALFYYGEAESAWSLVETPPYEGLRQESFISWLENCPKTEESFKRLIDYFDLNEVYPSAAFMEHINEFLVSNLDYKPGVPTYVDPKGGKCGACGQKLAENALTQEEFKMLSDHFLEKVLQDNDIFLNTTPEELEEYKRFIKQNGPFHYVLDALNILYSPNVSKQVRAASGRRVHVEYLENLLFQLATEGKRVLMIGRKHMNNLPRKHLRKLEEYGYLFLTDNQSIDDPFTIYATMKSGMQSVFVSRDIMRQHSYRLQDAEMARLFKRWRLSHQLSYFYDERRRKTVLEPFAPILPVPQKSSETLAWHIPFQIEDSASPHDFPKKWMCCTKKR